MGIVVAGGSVWFADSEGGNVVRLDPRTLRPVGDPIQVGAKPSWLAVAAGSLFVTDQDDGTVSRIDVRSAKKVGAPIRVAEPAKGATAPAIAASGTSVWVSSFASNTLTRINSTGVAAPAPTATVSHVAHGKITLHSTETLRGPDITDGHVAGTGRFTISGAINDEGTITSATKAYKGLHGKGIEVVDNYASTPATFTMQGTVS